MSQIVYVLLFNTGTDNEGIHTLRTPDGQDTILLFTDEDDATRFAVLLEAQEFATPKVEKISLDEMIEFCNGNGYSYHLIESEDQSLIIPPERNLAETTWQADRSPKENQNSEEILDRIRRSLERSFSPGPSDNPEDDLADRSAEQLSQSQLDEIRQNLENLFGG